MPFPGTPLQVPDFNKQEVEGIAVDAVKKEIAGGDIPTGTKLYKHTVVATVKFGSNNAIPQQYDFIGTLSKPITDGSLPTDNSELGGIINDFCKNSCIATPGGANDLYEAHLITKVTSYPDFAISVGFWALKYSGTITLVSLDSDTVTEL